MLRDMVRDPGAVLLLVAYAVLGFAAFWGPYYLARTSGQTRASNPIDGMQPVSLGFLIAIGFVGGLLAPRYEARFALASMAAFPLLAVVDMLRDPTSHNLWPLEFTMYAALSLLAVAAAAIARRLRG